MATAGFRSVAHYLVLTQQVATSTASPQESSAIEEATTTAVDATQAEPAQLPCDQQLCERPQESTASEPQGALLTGTSMPYTILTIVMCLTGLSV